MNDPGRPRGAPFFCLKGTGKERAVALPSRWAARAQGRGITCIRGFTVYNSNCGISPPS
jgi:hypothetical protein